MTLEVNVTGLDELKKKLGAKFAKTMQVITMAVGELVRAKLAQYPPRNAGPVQWASERQRRWYYANRAEQGLPLEYTRNSDPWSERLGPGWNVSKHGDMNAVVRPGASYAAYVQKDGMQQPMHAATGWITDVQAIEQVKESGDIQAIVRDAVEHALGG